MGITADLAGYLESEAIVPLLLQGDSLDLLRQFPSDSIDCAITSPPYWGQRNYASGGIGLEETPELFVESLLAIFAELKRALKPSGSFWLNIGDTYHSKSLVGIPWRVVLRMTDTQGWTLRNSIIWNKHKGGMDSTTDRLRNIHEHIFHFVKLPKGYYYNADAIRNKPRQSVMKNGSIVSATGVSGVSYKRKIELSTSLSEIEKRHALLELENVLQKMATGELADFRMIIRDQHRATHSDSEKVSGRARELKERGYYFLFYHPNGAMPGDVWDIIPEDTQNREKHYAPFPEDLCRLPILATCPPKGVVLDPFCGTGTANKVAHDLGRKSIGLDLSGEYLAIARKRTSQTNLALFA